MDLERGGTVQSGRADPHDGGKVATVWGCRERQEKMGIVRLNDIITAELNLNA